MIASIYLISLSHFQWYSATDWTIHHPLQYAAIYNQSAVYFEWLPNAAWRGFPFSPTGYPQSEFRLVGAAIFQMLTVANGHLSVSFTLSLFLLGGDERYWTGRGQQPSKVRLLFRSSKKPRLISTAIDALSTSRAFVMSAQLNPTRNLTVNHGIQHWLHCIQLTANRPNQVNYNADADEASHH